MSTPQPREQPITCRTCHLTKAAEQFRLRRTGKREKQCTRCAALDCAARRATTPPPVVAPDPVAEAFRLWLRSC